VVFAEWQVGQLVWSMLWFTLFFVWIWMFVRVFSDIIRSRDLSGWARAMWVLAVLILPIAGVLAYVVVRGDQMAENYAGGRASMRPGRPRVMVNDSASQAMVGRVG
jgi:hypothetical protein